MCRRWFEAIEGFLRGLANEVGDIFDNSLNDLLYTLTSGLSAVGTGFSYLALDIKYNGLLNFGEGRGNIPTEEAMETSTIRAVNYTFSGGFDCDTLSGDPSIEDFSRYLSGIMSVFPGTSYVSRGGEVGKLLTNQAMGVATAELVKQSILEMAK